MSTSPATPPQPTPTPGELQAEIKQTRADLGGTVEALAAKTDVKARAQEQLATTTAKAAHATGVARQRLAETSRRPEAQRAFVLILGAAILVATAIAVAKRRR